MIWRDGKQRITSNLLADDRCINRVIKICIGESSRKELLWQLAELRFSFGRQRIPNCGRFVSILFDFVLLQHSSSHVDAIVDSIGLPCRSIGQRDVQGDRRVLQHLANLFQPNMIIRSIADLAASAVSFGTVMTGSSFSRDVRIFSSEIFFMFGQTALGEAGMNLFPG